MAEFKIQKPFMNMVITYLFIFSTMYTLVYFWQIGTSNKVGVDAQTESTKNIGDLGIGVSITNPSSWIFGILEQLLNFLSWISPFAPVRALMYWILQPLDINFWTFIDLIFIRPVSWICTIITVDWALSKIPTVSSSQ